MWGVVILAAITACVADPWVKLQRTPLIHKKPGFGNIDTTLTRTVWDCARKCSGYDECRSVFYVHGTGECQTHNVVYTPASPGLIDTVAAVYYEKEYSSTTSPSTTSTDTTSTPTTTTTTTTTTTPTTTTTSTTTSTTSSTTSPTTATPCVPTPPACPLTSTTTFTHVVLPGCDEEFSFRIFIDASRDFWQSKSKCESEGGKLFSILTLAKMDYMLFLTTCTDYANLDFWIDGLYNAITSTWETTGGTPLPMSQGDFWAADRPNAADPNGQCVWMKTAKNYYFDDYSCTGLSSPVPLTVCELI